MSLGYSHDSFWDQTQRSFVVTMRAAEDRRVAEHNSGIVQAYVCAALMRHPAKKRLPKLESLLTKPRKGPQSWQEQLAIAKMWTAALGGTVKKRQS